VIANAILVVLQSEPALRDIAEFETFYVIFEGFSVVLFTFEFALRLWSCVEDERYGTHWLKGRLKWVFKPLSLIDIVAIVPFYIDLIDKSTGARAANVLLAVRLFRMLSFLKLERQKSEFGATLFVGVLLLLVASSFMFFFERDAQPDKFESVLSTMWWGVNTVTSVGYGDMVPVTVAGKVNTYVKGAEGGSTTIC
jgi:voltage-gated potassium channel